MKTNWTSRLTALLVLAVMATGPCWGGHYALAYWREVGSNENSNNHSIYVHVFDENGNPKSGVELRATWGTLLATTDSNGYCEVVMAAQNSYDMVCVDGSGSTSDVAYVMTTHRGPNYGHYSYDLAFMYKSNASNAGTFDTTLIGTLNLWDSSETDAPCTRSLTYYNLNPFDWYSDPTSLGTSSSYFGQTFVANASRIVACKAQATTGFGNHMRWSAQILQGGPNGSPIGPTKTSREMVSDEYHPIIVTWGINDVPVTPGNTYFLKIWNAAGGNMSTYHCNTNNYAGGVYYENSNPISSLDLKGLVVAASAGPPPSVLQNPSFEGGFSTAGVASGWTSFVTSGTPQFLDETSFVHGGAHAQKWWTSYGTHDAGLCQQLSATSGTSYTFSAWTWRYDPYNNGMDNVTDWVGIDPRGGTDPTSPNVVWDAGAYSWGIWTKQRVAAVAQGDLITVFIRGKARLAGSAMVTEADDAEFGLTPATGSITGTVRDTGGNLLGGATVSTSTGGYSTTSASDGTYTLADVAPATYNVTASKTLYGSQTLTGKTVTVAQTIICNFTLAAPQALNSVAQAKAIADGTAVSLAQKVISRKGAAAFWVQEADRSCGIKVNGTTTGSEGDRVNVAGALATENGERVLSTPEIGSLTSGAAPRPLGMSNRDLGGAPLGSYTPGAGSAEGPNNVGLLVACCGRVTYSAADHFYIDDRSAHSDGSGHAGVKVVTGSLTAPAVGRFERVAGISGLEPNGPSYTPVLRVLRQGDILLIPESAVTTGTISGRVTSGANAVSGATVSTNTGGYSTTTDFNGDYTLAEVAPGTYNVTASKTGYVPKTNTGVVVTVGQTTTSDFSLQVELPFSGISNGSFEGGFFNDPDVDHQTGTSWHRFSLSGVSKSGGDYAQYRSSHWSQSIYESIWVAGIYQQATNATVGQTYTASVWVRGSVPAVKFWVGIDPTGGTNALSSSVQWSAPVTPGTTWMQVSKQVAASSSTITMFVKVQNPVSANNYAWMDDASISAP